jgi:hypothetical protein
LTRRRVEARAFSLTRCVTVAASVAAAAAAADLQGSINLFHSPGSDKNLSLPLDKVVVLRLGNNALLHEVQRESSADIPSFCRPAVPRVVWWLSLRLSGWCVACARFDVPLPQSLSGYRLCGGTVHSGPLAIVTLLAFLLSCDCMRTAVRERCRANANVLAASACVRIGVFVSVACDFWSPRSVCRMRLLGLAHCWCFCSACAEQVAVGHHRRHHRELWRPNGAGPSVHNHARALLPPHLTTHAVILSSGGNLLPYSPWRRRQRVSQ